MAKDKPKNNAFFEHRLGHPVKYYCLELGARHLHLKY